MIRIAGIQPCEVIGDASACVSAMAATAASAEDAGAALVCFPECHLQGYITERAHIERNAIELHSDEVTGILDALSGLRPTLVFGLIERAGDHFFNTALVVKRGRLIGAHRKRTLRPGEAQVYSPGSETPVFEVDGLRLSINICADLTDPRWAQQAARQGAQLLVCPCNNMLPRDSAFEMRDAHNAIRADRCRESGLWLLSSDVTGRRDDRIAFGPTAVIDPSGTVVAQAPIERSGWVLHDIPI